MQWSKLGLVLATLTIISCSNDPKNNANDKKSEKVESEAESNTISLNRIQTFQDFPKAQLSMTQPASMELPEGENTFQFEVTNYNLKKATDDADMQGLANSSKGQHIHFILNNGPYDAQYDNEFTKDLPEGDHVLLAFLSRSYHMAVKNENSFVLKKLRVGNPTADKQMDVDFSAPHLFYSRPKGTYSGKGAQKVLLDFFLLNTELSEGGNHVLVTINGQEFKVTEWAPYAIEGMPMGENTIEIELVNSEGEYVKGPFNREKRTITLKK